MLYEDLRYAHEDLERLEQAIADRVLEDPKHIRSRLVQQHEIANFLSRIQNQSERALHIYNDEQDARITEIQSISTGDPFEEFYKQLDNIKSFHKRYPNEPVENLERAYKRIEDGGPSFAGDIDGMFTGEETFGRYFDLTMLHEEYLNLPGVKGTRKLNYTTYIEYFDKFLPPECPITRQEKMTDEYFSYVGSLAQYLESFIRRTRPLEDLDKLFKSFDDDFEQEWKEDKAPGWETYTSQANGGAANGPQTEGTGEGVWCSDCQREFKNDNVYTAHLTGKKHLNNAKTRKERAANGDTEMTNGTSTIGLPTGQRLKERAIAEREHRIRKLASAMSAIREDTRVNVERRAGMTDRERQQELAALYAEDTAMIQGTNHGDDEGEDDEEKVYNPLKLPLAWDGKPIPFWLYKLHGLGVEFPCEICGNYVYMGRRAFEKHFSESRHVYGLKCLGVTNTGLFREITGIEEAEKLWEKIQRDKKAGEAKKGGEGVEEMEDREGNVMPRKVYEDLMKAGLL
ncbi:hypothetical protein BAUCODRAFT_36716 [Baudoinia panamericana UAMH 10762]|uniref:Matrin-type domain-containing protein n=1 Tax=Baudoinia panamericana (strain UAMH 10762) TaxID=717646 RepID=M2LJ49_BAUPA|nr:uncharacterized protein BAUCODRAFT_36716 [Baudoinia panamericana UAMH 10762]EMC94247.1 hypothetical protein BAUCODRAFT_36716 [Baudoinia panamericana UAMH 10762]